MKERINKIIPTYAILPLISMLLLNSLTYSGSRLITNKFYHYTLSTKIDSMVPFISFFVFFYVIAYVYWAVGYILIARENKDICSKYIGAELIAKTTCLILFFLVPTTMIRPNIVGNSIWDFITKIIYYFDEPTNLFPSIHCLESWMCFRGSLELKKTPKWYPVLCFILTVFICLSTIFIKQHLVVDIIGGILAAEIGIFLIKIIRKWKNKKEGDKT